MYLYYIQELPIVYLFVHGICLYIFTSLQHKCDMFTKQALKFGLEQCKQRPSI